MFRLLHTLMDAVHHRIAHLDEGIARLDELNAKFRWRDLWKR
jgi:hypothetical protein